MLETGLIFAAGFLTAAIIAIMILPGINARAGRLARRRLADQFPISIAEMTAQMDHIRAEGAVALRRVERELEKERLAHAKARTALGAEEAAIRRRILNEAPSLAKVTQDNGQLTTELAAITEDRDARRIAMVELETQVQNLQDRLRAADMLAQDNRLLRTQIETLADKIALAAGHAPAAEAKDAVLTPPPKSRKRRAAAKVKAVKTFTSKPEAGLREEKL